MMQCACGFCLLGDIDLQIIQRVLQVKTLKAEAWIAF